MEIGGITEGLVVWTGAACRQIWRRKKATLSAIPPAQKFELCLR